MKKSLLLIVSLIFLVGCAAKKRQIVVIDEPVKEEVVVEIDQTLQEQTVMLEEVAPMPEEEQAVVEEVVVKEAGVYTIASGDNLYQICLEKDLFIWQLAELNGIKNPRIIPIGKDLKIPLEKKRAVSSGSYYKVDIGDYLSGIAGQVDKSVEDLADLNNIANVNRIEAGSLLKVK